ncbi:cytosolic 5'-nucleotidase 3-like [Styela clava]
MTSNSRKTLDKLFTGSHVHIKHRDAVMEKIQRLVSDGTSCLQVISDFDMTISKYKHLNKRCPSSHTILEMNSLIPNDVKTQLTNLKEKYHAIEIDPNLTQEEKIPHMIEWWTKAHKLISSSEIKKSHLQDNVSKSEAMLRDGSEHMIDTLHKHNVPLLIFSAGVGDVLEEVIRQKSNFHPNIKIVSNFMEFDETGTLIGFKGDLIHTFNKNESALEDNDYFENVKHRHNIIMMGDMLGDLTMANGVPKMNVCLKIGFLNAKFDELLEQFMDAWDIVLVDDQTMDVANAILDTIIEVGEQVAA